MDIPLSVVEAVRETKVDLAEQPKRAQYVKKITKRILHAIGNGLRTPTSIANALGVPKAKIQSNLCHLKAKGLVYSHKQANTNEHKYHLTTDKPVLDKLDLTKPKRKYTKRKSIYNKDGVNTTNSFNTPPKPSKTEVELNHEIDRLLQRISNLEVTLAEKDKEVWSLECEVFDKKAVIKYLEEKLFQLGVRV